MKPESPRLKTHLLRPLLWCCLSLLAWPAQAATDAAFAAKSDASSEILAEIGQHGFSRVLVEFRRPATASRLTPSGAGLETYKASIKDGRDAIVSSLFGNPDHPMDGRGFARALRNFEISPIFAVNVDQAELEALAADARVIRIHYDRLLQPTLNDSVPLVGMSGPAGAYVVAATGKGQAVAVIDTGVQAEHPFLSGKVVAEECFSNGANKNRSLCPNGTPSQTGPGAADPTTSACVEASGNICIHGTHVAGIAAGRDTAGTGQAANGIAKEGSIVAVQVFTRVDDNTLCNNRSPCVLAYTSDVLAGLNWVFSNLAGLSDKTKVASVNLSLGGGKYTGYCDGHPLKPIVDNLRSAGVATVIAAGNEGYVDAVASPGCISTAVTVGSSTKQDGISWFSNMASMVDLLGPGSGIVSSVPDSAYQSLNGTSMATPHVAGAFAAIRSRLPNATVAQIEEALKSTGVVIADDRASAPQTAKPRIQVDQALAALGAVPRSLTVNRTGSGTVTSEPSGIDCGTACNANFDDGATVTLTATAGAGHRFSGWGGACSASGATCTLTMNSDQSVVSTFVQTHPLTVALTGDATGRVTSEPAGIDCGTTCAAEFPDKAPVVLTAIGGTYVAFTGWSGDCQGMGPCSIAMDAARNVSANFVVGAPLTVVLQGSGRVVADNGSLDCQETCTATVPKGAKVLLTATPAEGYKFKGWSGSGCSGRKPCRVKVQKAKSVKAKFQPVR